MKLLNCFTLKINILDKKKSVKIPVVLGSEKLPITLPL